MTLVIGHKGAAGLAPENTLAAFRVASEVGADGVELDVRCTGDGALAVHHDAELPDGRVVATTGWSDLPDDVADLDAALDICRGFAIVNVEIKNWPADVDYDDTLSVAEAVVAALAPRSAPERERLVVSCFHLPTIDRVRELAPDLVTGWLVGLVGAHAGDDGGAAIVARTVDQGHRALHPHHALVTPALVERAHDEELAVNAWTCNDPERIRGLAEAGVDGIITDFPDIALGALGRSRGGRETLPPRPPPT